MTYGLLAYLNNNLDKSLELLSKMIKQADERGEIETLDAAVYHNLGSVCIEAMVYDQAIEFLFRSDQRDPSNKEAHFDRAVAYFEQAHLIWLLKITCSLLKVKECLNLHLNQQKSFQLLC